MKKEQERKAAERRKVIDERCGLPKDLDNASEGKDHPQMFLQLGAQLSMSLTNDRQFSTVLTNQGQAQSSFTQIDIF